MIQTQLLHGFISLSLLMLTLIVTVSITILSIIISKNTHLLYDYQLYTQQYYTADASLKLALKHLPRLKELPSNQTHFKALWYEVYMNGFPINPFNTHTIFVWRYSNNVVAISIYKTGHRLILMGELNPNKKEYSRIYALDKDRIY